MSKEPGSGSRPQCARNRRFPAHYNSAALFLPLSSKWDNIPPAALLLPGPLVASYQQVTVLTGDPGSAACWLLLARRVQPSAGAAAVTIA